MDITIHGRGANEPDGHGVVSSQFLCVAIAYWQLGARQHGRGPCLLLLKSLSPEAATRLWREPRGGQWQLQFQLQFAV